MNLDISNKRREFLTDKEKENLETLTSQYGSGVFVSKKLGFTLSTLINIKKNGYGSLRNIRAIRRLLKKQESTCSL